MSRSDINRRLGDTARRLLAPATSGTVDEYGRLHLTRRASSRAAAVIDQPFIKRRNVCRARQLRGQAISQARISIIILQSTRISMAPSLNIDQLGHTASPVPVKHHDRRYRDIPWVPIPAISSELPHARVRAGLINRRTCLEITSQIKRFGGKPCAFAWRVLNSD